MWYDNHEGRKRKHQNRWGSELGKVGKKFKEMNLGEEVKHPQEKLIEGKATIPQGTTMVWDKKKGDYTNNNKEGEKLEEINRKRGEEPKVHTPAVRTAEPNRRAGCDSKVFMSFIPAVTKSPIRTVGMNKVGKRRSADFSGHQTADPNR
ncbi:unnamed protein product [Cochlearia groenlandica]